MSSSRIRKFAHKPIADPFEGDEKAQTAAYRRLFDSKDGQKVLDSMIYDMDMQHPNLARDSYQAGFNTGKQYFIHHIISALAAEYEKVEEPDL